MILLISLVPDQATLLANLAAWLQLVNGDSPYQPFSAFAGNHSFIDFDLLIERGLLTEADL